MTAVLLAAGWFFLGYALRHWAVAAWYKLKLRRQRHQEPPARVHPAQPAPGPNPPQPGQSGIHRGPIMRIDMWACGCMWIYTPETGWTQDIDCLDERLRRLLTP